MGLPFGRNSITGIVKRHTSQRVTDELSSLRTRIKELEDYNARLLSENIDQGNMICNLRECAQCLAGEVDRLKEQKESALKHEIMWQDAHTELQVENEKLHKGLCDRGKLVHAEHECVLENIELKAANAKLTKQVKKLKALDHKDRLGGHG